MALVDLAQARSAAPPDDRAAPVDGRDRWPFAPPRRLPPRTDRSARSRRRRGWHRAATGSRDRPPSSRSRAPAGRSRCSGAGRASCRARRGSHNRGRPPAADRASRPARCSARSGRPPRRGGRCAQAPRPACCRPAPALRLPRARARGRRRLLLARRFGQRLARPSAMAPALSPARNASRPISWNSCARSIELPSSPSRSRPDAKQALARSRSPASQCSPPILRCRRATPARSAVGLELLPHRFVVRERLGPPPGERQQIREPLAHRLHLVIAGLAVGERAQRALVVADRIVVGVDRRAPSRRPPSGSARPWSCPVRGSSGSPSASRSLSRSGCGPAARSSARPARSCSSVRRDRRRFWYTTSCTSACVNR